MIVPLLLPVTIFMRQLATDHRRLAHHLCRGAQRARLIRL
jgi:hypothetical protein